MAPQKKATSDALSSDDAVNRTESGDSDRSKEDLATTAQIDEDEVVVAASRTSPRAGVTALRRDGTPRLRADGAGPGARRAGVEPPARVSDARPASDGRTGQNRRATQLEELRERRMEKLGGRRAKAVENAPADAETLADSRPTVERAAQPVRPAKMRLRHFGILLSLVIMVFAPLGLSCWYLWTHAVDQYESRVGFAVRAEGQVTTPDLFGGILGSTGGSTSEDMHILSEYIVSQEIVELIDAKLNLREKYSRYPADQIYSFDSSGTIEDLVAYWQRMVVVDYNSTTGLMELTVYAFTPEDAQEISAAVLEQSSKIINNLSAIALEDSTRYARENLDAARTRATEARAALAEFRVVNKVADPTAAVASQMGVVSSLQQQLAAALVELDLIRAGSKANDPRIVQIERRITIIESRIDQERSNMGVGDGGAGFAEILSEYERLTVEKTFAEQTYLAALSGYDGAMSKASQQSRYLANYVEPTLAEASTAPVRPLVALVVGLIAFFIWASAVLIYYALRDRR